MFYVLSLCYAFRFLIILTAVEIHFTQGQPRTREVQQQSKDTAGAVAKVKGQVVDAWGQHAWPAGIRGQGFLVEVGAVLAEVYLDLRWQLWGWEEVVRVSEEVWEKERKFLGKIKCVSVCVCERVREEVFRVKERVCVCVWEWVCEWRNL